LCSDWAWEALWLSLTIIVTTSGDWRLRREVERISGEVNRVNWRYRHEFDSWRLRRQIDSLRYELHQIEVRLHVRGGDYYRWD